MMQPADIATLMRLSEIVRERGILLQVADDAPSDGRLVTVRGRELVSFGSCSALGLEVDPRLKEAAKAAIDRYGVQLSSSRAYLSTPLYRPVEEAFAAFTGRPVIVFPSVSLAHLGALPILVSPGDTVLYDLAVHASVQHNLPILAAAGATVQRLPHGDYGVLERRLDQLADGTGKVWYLCDGIYSMHGDLLDRARLASLLAAHPRLWAYVDDAHGAACFGPRGEGWALGGEPLPRTVVALSGAKSFGASGGILVLPDAELHQRVRVAGPSLIFGGPLAPPILAALGAALAIVDSPEGARMRAELEARILHFNEACRALGVPLTSVDPTPMRCVPVGDEERALAVYEALVAAGYYTNVAVHPAVPRGRALMRLSVTRHHTLDDINGAVATLAAACRAA